MKYFQRWAFAAAIFATFCLSAPLSAQTARQMSPVYIDPDNGFVYFLVSNNGSKTISNLFGTVYAYGSPVRPGLWRINNPHAEGMKVSLGAHRPGSAALYRFMVSSDNMDFTNYMLGIDDDSLFFPVRAGR